MADTTDGIFWGPLSSVQTSEMSDALNQPRTPSSELDKDAFLKLLITQMKYQDPLNPMDDKEFLGQMAQFTALEQMQNLNAAYSKSQAYSMIGKSVYAEYNDQQTGEYMQVSGTVSAVTVKNGETYLFVDGYDVPLSSVSIVGDDTLVTSQLDAIYENVYNTRNQNYVGKYIQALLMDNKGNVTDYVEGIVDYVKTNGAKSVLVVGNKEVFPDEVATVSDNPLLIGKTLDVQVTDKNGDKVIIEDAAIKNITIKNNKAYLDIDGYSVPIDKINYVMEALQYVGQNVSYASYNGAVDSILIKGGIPFFVIGDDELSYLTYKDS